jgi:uncharacterized membrane protein
MDNQHLYRKISTTIDIICVIGFPLVLGILINYVLAIGVFVIIASVTLLRRRFLGERAEKLVLGAVPSTRRDGEKDDSLVDSRPNGPLRIMAVATLVMTCLLTVRLIASFGLGSPIPWIPVGCLVIVWVGVAIFAFGYRFKRHSQGSGDYDS